jgi:predicted nucleotidyltransferase
MAKRSSALRGAVRKYVKALTANGIRVQQVFLYGSHAKKRAHPDSDIDIIIVSEDFRGKNLLERLQILAKAGYGIYEPIEAYGFTPEEVQNRDLSTFWEEILETEAISITEEVLV